MNFETSVIPENPVAFTVKLYWLRYFLAYERLYVSNRPNLEMKRFRSREIDEVKE